MSDSEWMSRLRKFASTEAWPAGLPDRRNGVSCIKGERGLGNSPTRVLKQLRENHTEEWLHRVARSPKSLLEQARSVLCLTSVGNETGQILMSVLTAQEGAGLDMMAANLVRRYQQAGVGPPVLLYVDCGCCIESGETKLKARFSGWPDMTGCTTDAHQLYPIFMSRLSTSIFEWDAADLALLREAKKQQLQSQGLSFLTDADVSSHLTKDELALHCRRRTRGEGTTTQLLEELLLGLTGTGGSDSLGVPCWTGRGWSTSCVSRGSASRTRQVLLCTSKQGSSQREDYVCLRTDVDQCQQPECSDVPAGRTAQVEPGPWYCCPGYWTICLHSYSGDLLHCVNKNFEKLFGRKMVPEFCPPSRYTGELIGMQYLLQQTGQALQDMHPDSEETAQLIEEHEDVMEEDEGFSDIRHSAGPRGPTGSSLSDSLWHFHPGPQQNHPCPQQNHPGPQQNHPGPQQNHPNIWHFHPGSQHNHRSPEQNNTDPKPICTGLCC
ncbi:hypothetical protein JOQ06_026017 [Pogonophryne albipinna]|uniref:Uncharacterized protein n=1 Tax=Pogonophryne albipinna TaxID=1090488 RepID=A0AAD6AEQ5_9TELE|nr:hypothetical protein JOQ06_026017 [Pogonophryne albipinna]